MGRRAAGWAGETAAQQTKRAHPVLDALRSAFRILAAACALVGCVWAAVRVEQFVITDKQFLLPGPPEPGVPSDSFQIQGVVHSSEQRVIETFQRDFGRSIYLCPIEERRRRLLAIDWVRDASVSRIWPNRLIVRITERTPVAFAQMPGAEGSMAYTLIDGEGVILDPQKAGKMALPVLAGFPANDPEAARRERVKRFLVLQQELGKGLDRISEIDVSDLENLKVTQESGGRALTLMLGNQKYLQRYENFINNEEEIRKRLQGAMVLDLRLRDRITAVGDVEPQSAPARKELERLP